MTSAIMKDLATPRPTRPQSVVVDTSSSPFARLRPVPVAAVRLTDTFLAPRIANNRTVTIPSQYKLLEETGRLENFRRAAGQSDAPFQGIYFNDSDVYKWLEGAAWALASGPDPEIEAAVATTVDLIAAAQHPDGYINTYFSRDRAGERWTNHDLHEMYCAGHLFQAAVAHYRATGETTLLDVASRFADYLCDTFGPEEEGKRFGIDGHEEIELAMVELGRATGRRRYVDQARYFIDARGHKRLPNPYDGRFEKWYHQDHVPIREMEIMIGHAVRAVYYTSGATDLYAEDGDLALKAAMERLWERMISRQTYVSGAIGARHEGEAFGGDYELPNALAYAESCAAIGSVMWAWRLLAIDGDARYADLVEHTLYNAVLPGLSLEGEEYFYENPLANDGDHRRQAWFNCACCPPNLTRTLASLTGYLYSTSDDRTIWVHLYAAGNAEITLPDGPTVRLTQETSYPWSGDIAIRVDAEGEFGLKVRIPAWAEDATVSVNGEPIAGAITPETYVEIRRSWAPGDLVRIALPLTVRWIVSHPAVTENEGRVALMRGPLLYCLEGVDLNGAVPDDVVLPPGAAITVAERPDLLGGIVALELRAEVEVPDPGWRGSLYRNADHRANRVAAATTVTAIPYFAWANRDPAPMRVWIRTHHS